ncbi:unnamed protein product [Rotaria sp. Silwood2]|nr:unnamed protein product [Rotaria sp. Silwood2]
MKKFVMFYDWNIIMLPYFNPVGNRQSGLIGEDPIVRRNNLISYVAQVAVDGLPYVNVTGTDYDIHDGTGVRDYIHVVDLATGHIACVKKFEENCALQICSLGTEELRNYAKSFEDREYQALIAVAGKMNCQSFTTKIFATAANITLEKTRSIILFLVPNLLF